MLTELGVRNLEWNYCECGCKCSEITIGGLHFTLFDDLKGGLYFYRGHHARSFGKRIESREQAEKLIREALAEAGIA